MLREVPGKLGSGSCGGCCRGWDDRSCRRVRGLETRDEGGTAEGSRAGTGSEGGTAGGTQVGKRMTQSRVLAVASFCSPLDELQLRAVAAVGWAAAVAD